MSSLLKCVSACQVPRRRGGRGLARLGGKTEELHSSWRDCAQQVQVRPLTSSGDQLLFLNLNCETTLGYYYYYYYLWQTA